LDDLELTTSEARYLAAYNRSWFRHIPRRVHGEKKSINLGVERELGDRFNAAARLERRPASQVLRDLMHAYIGEVERKHGPIGNRSAWANLKRGRRLANAQASIELEGHVIPDEMKAVIARFMRNEVTIDAVGGKADELARSQFIRRSK
jgi:hypothetical protein